MAVVSKRAVQVYLRPEQLAALRTLAQQRKVPVAELVRRGVDKVLAEAPAEQDPLWQIVGLGDSGLGDLAAKHDEYIARFSREDNH